MNRIFSFVLAASLLSSAAAVAQPGNSGRNDQGRSGQDRYEAYRNDPGVRMSAPRFSRRDRLPDQYRRNQQYAVNDWQQRNLRRPPHGYHWVRDDNNNYFLAAVTTGLILDLMLNGR